MPVLARPFYQDPFSPVLFTSEPLAVTLEQRLYIREILLKSCSDTQFAHKAYDSIVAVLTGGSVTPAAVTSLNPSSVTLGSESFTVRVLGTGFTPTTKIVFNGYEEPTTFVSPTEVTTGVDMSVWAAPAIVPVGVLNDDGVPSNTQSFTFNEVGSGTFGKTPLKPVVAPTPTPAAKTAEKK